MPHFFGLDNSYRETVLEEFYYLMRAMNISYEAIRSMPVTYRRWFIKRYSRDVIGQKEKDKYGLDDDTPLSALHKNS